jgi:hypothetical protein
MIFKSSWACFPLHHPTASLCPFRSLGLQVYDTLEKAKQKPSFSLCSFPKAVGADVKMGIFQMGRES